MVAEVLVVAVALDAEADGAEEAEAGLEEAGILKEEKVGANAQSHVYTYIHTQHMYTIMHYEVHCRMLYLIWMQLRVMVF